jgi:hypothetical protein
MGKLIDRLLTVEAYVVMLGLTGAYYAYVDRPAPAYLHLVAIIFLLNKKNAVDYAVAKQRYKLNKYLKKDEYKDRNDD